MFKCFIKTGCESLSCHELSSCEVFQEFVVGINLLYNTTSGYEFSDLRLLSWLFVLLWFCHGLPKEETVLILSSVPTCNKFNINQGIKESVEACVLYKPSAKGGRRTISDDWKVGFCINNGFQEAKALLPGTYHQCHNGSSTQEGDEEVGSCRTIDPMGYRAKWVWYQVLA